MLMPYKRSERDHIERMVRAAAFALQPDLEHLRYDLGEDHDGDPCIYFRMVVRDEIVSLKSDFARVRQMEEAIRRIVEPDEYGLLSYFNLRSKSEHRADPDPKWAKEAA